jgi:carbonic anhydrase/acetyltransferase-like protein (isoleucine patch superfamily)
MPLFSLDGVAPQVHPTSVVMHDANVIGNVILRANSSVWFGSTLRGDANSIEIGEGSNVQEQCVLHIDRDNAIVVGKNCTVGHRVILHGCTIGDNTLVGMGAIIQNGAKIGKGCIVVGVPGKLVRIQSQAEMDSLVSSALNYQHNARVFSAGLSRL